MSADTYETVTVERRASLKVSRSEFIGIAFPLGSSTLFASELQRIVKEFFDATHHCWAYRLFDEGREEGRSSDAGEPSGSAGRPILNTIVSAGLSDTGVVVVRYYGGVKLGTGGLARAYRDAAQLALSEAPRERRFVYEEITVLVPFSQLSTAYRLVDPPRVLLRGESFAEQNLFLFAVRRSESAEFRRQLTELQLDIARPS